MATPVLSNSRSASCNCTKEELMSQKKNPLDVFDDCPVCLLDNILCKVGQHPSTTTPTSATQFRSAPPFRKLVFALCRWKSDGSGFVIVGTAVAVKSASSDILLTAGHCLKFPSCQYFCALEIRYPYDLTKAPKNSFEVAIVTSKMRNPDLGVLRRESGRFEQDCPGLVLPGQLPWNVDPDGWMANAYIFHVPVEVINNADNDEAGGVDLCCDVLANVSLRFPSRHHFRLAAVQRGSSGGAVITNEGDLIGILVNTQAYGALQLGGVYQQSENIDNTAETADNVTEFHSADAKDSCDMISLSVASSFIPESGSTAVIPSLASIRVGPTLYSMQDFLKRTSQQVKLGSVDVELTEKDYGSGK